MSLESTASRPQCPSRGRGSATRSQGPFLDDTPDREGSLTWWSLARNKRSVVVDLDTDDGRETLARPAAEADFLIESSAPGWMSGRGLGYEQLAELNLGLIYASLTAFGRDGPKSHCAATDLTIPAASGALYLTGDTDRAPGPAEPRATGGTPCGRRGRGGRARRFARACQLGTRAARGRIRSTDGRGSGVCAPHGPHGRRLSTVACHGANVVRPNIRVGRARRLRRLHAELRRRQRALHQAPHRLGLERRPHRRRRTTTGSVRSTPAGCPPSGCWRRAPTASASG